MSSTALLKAKDGKNVVMSLQYSTYSTVLYTAILYSTIHTVHVKPAREGETSHLNVKQPLQEKSVPCCTAPCCAVLYCTALQSASLYCTVLYCLYSLEVGQGHVLKERGVSGHQSLPLLAIDLAVLIVVCILKSLASKKKKRQKGGAHRG